MMEQAVQDALGGEARIVERARNKDPAAIRAIIRQHNQRLYRIARGILRDDGEAEDVLQEAYIRAFTHLDRFRGEARLGTWLARIVMNEALGRLRARRHRPTLEWSVVEESARTAGRVIAFPNANPNVDPEATMAQREIRLLLERFIDELPEPFRLVVIARLIEGMSTAETAEIFDISTETVKSRLHRARGLLKRKMEAYVGPVLGDAFPFGGHRCERVTETVLKRLGLE